MAKRTTKATPAPAPAADPVLEPVAEAVGPEPVAEAEIEVAADPAAPLDSDGGTDGPGEAAPDLDDHTAPVAAAQSKLPDVEDPETIEAVSAEPIQTEADMAPISITITNHSETVVRLGINGRVTTLPVGIPVEVSEDQIYALKHAGVSFKFTE